MEEAQMGKRYQPIEIMQAFLILRQQNNVIGEALFVILAGQISFHAVDHFDVELFVNDGIHRFGKSLYDAMIGNSDSRPSPASRCLYQGLGRHDRVHHAHLRVGMKLHPLFRRVVHACGDGFFLYAVGE